MGGLDEVTLDSFICTSSSPNGNNAPIVSLHVAVANDEDQPKDTTTISMTELDAGELVQQFFHILIMLRLEQTLASLSPLISFALYR